ncbi:hypothetical protein MASSI9I_90425 [Massilia sp. 9I]|nr:hypothetical protein MASSI9I_90425 [Massilia sp. 9I]
MNAPNEINAAAIKTGATEKVTPMMHGCLLEQEGAKKDRSYAKSYAGRFPFINAN